MNKDAIIRKIAELFPSRKANVDASPEDIPFLRRFSGDLEEMVNAYRIGGVRAMVHAHAVRDSQSVEIIEQIARSGSAGEISNFVQLHESGIVSEEEIRTLSPSHIQTKIIREKYAVAVSLLRERIRSNADYYKGIVHDEAYSTAKRGFSSFISIMAIAMPLILFASFATSSSGAETYARNYFNGKYVASTKPVLKPTPEQSRIEGIDFEIVSSDLYARTQLENLAFLVKKGGLSSEKVVNEYRAISFSFPLTKEAFDADSAAAVEALRNLDSMNAISGIERMYNTYSNSERLTTGSIVFLINEYFNRYAKSSSRDEAVQKAVSFFSDIAERHAGTHTAFETFYILGEIMAGKESLISVYGIESSMGDVKLDPRVRASGDPNNAIQFYLKSMGGTDLRVIRAYYAASLIKDIDPEARMSYLSMAIDYAALTETPSSKTPWLGGAYYDLASLYLDLGLYDDSQKALDSLKKDYPKSLYSQKGLELAQKVADARKKEEDSTKEDREKAFKQWYSGIKEAANGR